MTSHHIEPGQGGGEPEPRKKRNYVGAPAIFRLERECEQINRAFGGFGCYLVGSALERPDYRDVDVRFILEDSEFYVLFPDAQNQGRWQSDTRWLLLTVALSEHLSRAIGLRVDFQFQPQGEANARHHGPRDPLGLRFAKDRP